MKKLELHFSKTYSKREYGTLVVCCNVIPSITAIVVDNELKDLGSNVVNDKDDSYLCIGFDWLFWGVSLTYYYNR